MDMGKKIDWDNWRRKYIQGMELADISALQGAPSHGSLRNRSSKEDWPQQRRRFDDNTVTIATAVIPEAQSVAKKASQIIDAAEMLTQHNRLSRAAISLAVMWLNDAKDHKNVLTLLTPKDAIALLKWGVDTQRITEGLATERTEVTGHTTIDYKSLSDAELDAIADG